MRRNVNLDCNFIQYSWIHSTKPETMNKIIFTNDRVFMALVGPSGSGKTQLVFQMLFGGTFYPQIQSTYYFYREYQPIFSKVEQLINIQFVQFSSFDITKDLNNCLLVFDDSCEEIYKDKEFVKIATSGRHRNLHVIYIKHNLFQQSRWSRTIDLNTTHIVLFKSPRDVHQIDYLGKQLDKLVFLRDCYHLATSETFGHLLIDLNPKTSECLRFCSNITPPGVTIFYLPSSKAVTTYLTDEREKQGYAEAYASKINRKATQALTTIQ